MRRFKVSKPQFPVIQILVPPQSGGMEQTFRLDAQQYHALTVGDKGTLSYKGTRFVSFVGEQ